MRKTDRMRKDW